MKRYAKPGCTVDLLCPARTAAPSGAGVAMRYCRSVTDMVKVPIALSQPQKYRFLESALAASALDEIEMMRLATPVLDDLARATGESAHFSVPMGDAVVVAVARTSGPGAFQLTYRIGVVRPAHCTALGKIMLAALAPGQFERCLQRVELKAYTSKSIASAEQLAREIAKVRRAGLAFDDGEFDSELRFVALPVRDFSGRVIGAIGISGPVWRLSIVALQKRVRAVRATADSLSGEFGFAGEPERRVMAAV